jgi:hypothetical protein
MMASQDGALASSRVVHVAAQALAAQEGEVAIKSPAEAVALIGHACMISVGFRLIGLGEESRLGRLAFLWHIGRSWNGHGIERFGRGCVVI